MVEFSVEIKSEVKRYILEYGVDDWVFPVFAYSAADIALDLACHPLLAEVIPEMVDEGLVVFADPDKDWEEPLKFGIFR